MLTAQYATSSSNKTPPRYGIVALQRGLQILSLLAEADRELSATQIARASKLHASTVHRFLVNLEESGYVIRDEQGNYSLGSSCISLGRAALNRLDVRRASMAVLAELNRVTRETVHLTIPNGLMAVYVEKFESLEPLRIFSHVGATVPLHCTAVGKIFLAFLPSQERTEILKKLDMVRFTPATICSIQEMEAELKLIRQNHYSFDNEEHEAHIKCVAGPIWDHSGTVIAALSVTGPTTRMSRSRMRQLVPLVQKASMAISETLGYSAPSQNGKRKA